MRRGIYFSLEKREEYWEDFFGKDVLKSIVKKKKGIKFYELFFDILKMF